MAINWNDYYNQAKTEIEPTYNERLAASAAAKAAEVGALDTQKATNQKQLDQSLGGALQSAYITRRMAERDLPQTLAAQGMAGGATETTTNQLWNNYLKSRNTAQGSHDRSITDLLSSYNTNVAGINSRYSQNDAAMLRERDQDIDSRTDTLFNSAWQEYNAAEQKRQYEEQLALQKAENERAQREFDWNMEQARQAAAASTAAASTSSGGSSGGSGSGSGGGTSKSNWSGSGYYYTGSGWQKISDEAQYNKAAGVYGKQLVKIPGATTAAAASKALW